VAVSLAPPTLADGEPPPALRVATSGDYAPFSIIAPGAAPSSVAGFDAAVARAYAHDRGLDIEWRSFRWPSLLTDLGSHRFDVAMSGITVRPERSIAGRFTIPVATSGAVVMVREVDSNRTSSIRQLTDLDREDVRIAVNAGGHLERVTRATFARAVVLAIPDNAAVIAALLAGEVDGVVTDTLEAPHWQALGGGLRVLGPFTRDRKAYLLEPTSAARARDIDAWLLAREADGQLQQLRARFLGEPEDAECVATPLVAVLASMNERLALMPAVAEAKHRSQLAIEAPSVETRVLAAAEAAVHAAAIEKARDGSDARPPSPQAVRALFRQQIEAAKEIQRSVLARAPHAGPAPDPGPDLERDLRPALLRIGERIAWLLVRLPAGLDEDRVLRVTRVELADRQLSDERLSGLATALHRVARSMAPVAR